MMGMANKIWMIAQHGTGKGLGVRVNAWRYATALTLTQLNRGYTMRTSCSFTLQEAMRTDPVVTSSVVTTPHPMDGTVAQERAWKRERMETTRVAPLSSCKKLEPDSTEPARVGNLVARKR